MLTAAPRARTTRPCARMAPAPTWISPRITAERAISGCGWSTSIWFKLTATHRPHGRPGVRPVVPDTTRALAARLPGPALREQRSGAGLPGQRLVKPSVGRWALGAPRNGDRGPAGLSPQGAHRDEELYGRGRLCAYSGGGSWFLSAP